MDGVWLVFSHFNSIKADAFRAESQGGLQSFEVRVSCWLIVEDDHGWTCWLIWLLWLKVSKMYLASSELMPGLPSGFVDSSALLGGTNLCA